MSLTDAPVRYVARGVAANDGSFNPSDPPEAQADSRVREADGAPAVTSEVVRAFLKSREARKQLEDLVSTKVAEADVDDLVQDALEEAFRAHLRTPPRRAEAMTTWLAVIGRRVIADFHAKRTRRKKYEGAMPGDASADDADLEGASVEDASVENARALPEPSHDPRKLDDAVLSEVLPGRAIEWLEQQVAKSEMDRETLAILRERMEGKKTYEQLAGERGMTLTALSSRIFAFKGKYGPRYRKWRARTLLALFVFVIAAVVALIAILRRTRPHDVAKPHIEQGAPASH